MLKYHVKITDNETGEVITDSDRGCIIAGFGNKSGAAEFAAYDCEMYMIAGTIEAALKAIEKVCKSDSKIAFIVDCIMKKGGVLSD